ncbi:glycerophosphodiester phosphodiesterase family protein [Nitrosococcus oceani]|uniref:glycerophosphodiester phosphodiesterase family protein n=1 Tax=Nitrosococcus oceani TaxID=1229 RepID=UPI0004E90D73|nr:glycerophosphodiester phosphodiesterase family protein [Nitrosococcus oceani]KFI23065.1 glycerophosphodiester phosphodiesterase [Nitrosococcus oceani]
MRLTTVNLLIVIISAALLALVLVDEAEDGQDDYWRALSANKERKQPVQLGPRPFYLVEVMEESELKKVLQGCAKGPFYKTDFSIGHRGAPLQFPEHTKESYQAAARMGAGILECDVTFTQDRELVCRHSQCDLHTTTNILATDLAAKCSEAFIPAVLDAMTGNIITPASAKCCTSDITFDEFKTLKGKMDAFNPAATTLKGYLNAIPSWRTELYSNNGTLLSHAESIELFKILGVKFTPELKAPAVAMPFEGHYTQEDYAQQLIDEYRRAGIPAKNVYAQSFRLDDVLYWINKAPEFGKQAIFLDDASLVGDLDPSLTAMENLAAQGVKIIAPPLWALLELNKDNEIVPSEYALNARAAGLNIITWTLERSGPLKDGGGWYYQTLANVIDNDGDMLEVLDILAKDVGILGIFSDWPATVTYYANCMGLTGQSEETGRADF